MKAEQFEAQRDELDRLRIEIEALRASRKRLLLAGDADRRSIERELHDGVHQLFVALAVNAQLLGQAVGSDPAAARRLLEDLSRDIRRGLDATVLLAQRIYPAMLDAGEFAALLRSAAVDARVPASIDVVAGRHHLPEVEMTVFMLWLSALTHARPGARVTIRVRDGEHDLTFDVIGDVADWNADLDRMRDRLESLGGQLTIEPQGDGRTRAFGSLPIP